MSGSIGPSLDLNLLGPTLDPSITFTRASTATYFDVTGTLQTGAINAPRFDYDPVALTPRGLLIEEARTNLLLNSATLGTQSAAVTAQSYALSFYGTGTVTLSGTSTAGPLVGTGAFPQRVSLIFTPAAGTLTLTVTGSVLNAQLEAGAFPTSYIPTTTVAVTRAVDVATFPVGAWFSALTLTMCSEYMTPYAAGLPSGSAYVSAELDDATNQYTVTLRNTPPGAFATIFVAGAVTGQGVATAITANTPIKHAITLNTPTLTATTAVNGGAVSSFTITSSPTATVTRLNIASGRNSPLNGWTRRIQFWPRILSNSELQAATSLSGPLLDLYLTGPTLPTGLTLTRSTTGTYVDATGTVQTAAINAPRFGYDPISHAPLGLLIEETRTNLAYPSVDQSAAGWGISPAACLLATGNAGIAPDGTNTATSVVTNDTVASAHNLFRSYAGGTINTTYCGSVFAKAGAYPRVSVNFGNTAFPAGATGGLFDLTTGTIVATSGTTVCSITPYPNGWYRLSVTATSNATGGSYVFGLNPAPSTVTLVSQSYVPVSTGLGIFTWGAQVETSAFLTAPTSYIPTTTTSVARAFDLCSMPTAAWYNASLGSFAVDGTMQQVLAGNQDIVGFDDGSISNCTIARVTSNQFYVIEASAGVGQASANTANTVLPSTPFRAAMTYNAGALTGSLNGGAVVSSSGTAPVSTNRLNLSAVRQAAQNGFKSRVRYWPRVLANVELQEATSLGVQARAMVLA